VNRALARCLPVAALAASVTGCALAVDPPRAVPYPSDWPPLLALERLGADPDCSRLNGTYGNMPMDWEDGGQRLFTVTLSSLLGSPRDDELTSETPSLGAGRIRDRWAGSRVALDISRDGGVTRAILDGAALTTLPATSCTTAERGHTAALELRSGDRTLVPELATTGVQRVRVQLHATFEGDLVARIDVEARQQLFDPIGYPPLQRYWLRYRAARDEAPAAAAASP
jgi:hypothetical protein